MSLRWRFLRDRFAPPAELGAAIVAASLHRAADEYVKHHMPLGALITEAEHGPAIAPFRQLLPAALLRRGLCLDDVAGGWRVVRSPWPPLPPLLAECSVCHASIFHCSHGEGAVLFDATTE